MTSSELRQRLRGREPVFGTLIVSSSPRWFDVIRGCGLDFVFIDTEHIALDRSELSWMCQAYAAIGLPPIVRIPAPNPFAATMALDRGAAGVVAPYMETVDQVQVLRGAVKKRPIKGRKLDGILASEVAEPDLERFMNKGTSERPLIINIESVPAIEAMDDILAVPDLDGLLIGRRDLSSNLGLPEQYDHPDFIEACSAVFRKARAVEIGAGIHFGESPNSRSVFSRTVPTC